MLHHHYESLDYILQLHEEFSWGLSEGEGGGLCSNTLKDNFAKFSS